MRAFLSHILKPTFFSRPTLTVAQELLGKFLVRKTEEGEIVGMITEVEAYAGQEDHASHASRGRTPRTSVMFGPSGHWYVYMIYGMYHCLNIVTESEGYPAAVLIRSVDGVKGPGRLCRHFQVNKSLNTLWADKRSGLWVEDRGITISSDSILTSPRIGVDYAGDWKDKPWRFRVAP